MASFFKATITSSLRSVFTIAYLLIPSILLSVPVDSTDDNKPTVQELNLQLQKIAEQLLEIEKSEPFIHVDTVVPKSIDTSWVIYRGAKLWPIHLNYGKTTPQQRAENILKKLNSIAFYNIEDVIDALKIEIIDGEYLVKTDTNILFRVTKADANILDSEIEYLTKKRIKLLQQQSSTTALIAHNSDILWRIGKLVLILVVIIVLIKLLNYGFTRLKKHLISLTGSKIRGVTIKGFEIINDEQVVKVFLFISRLLRLVLALVIIFFSLPIVFSLFPWTESLATTLIGYILNPLQEYFWLFIHYIPNLISIFIIAYIGHFIIKLISYFGKELENKNLTIPGFYPDWAKPTANLAKFAIYTILLIFIFPFLPGSDSPIFKGVSVFVGILITMGSSSSVNNLVAGLVLTYMRPFRIGDRIKVEKILGFVIEKNLLVTRLRTAKQEIITIPNSKILNTNIINYSTSIQENDGVIVHNTITIGYDVPWRKIHKALLSATEGIESIATNPKPFVLQTSLNDFYVSYEINAYVTDVKTIIGTQSRLNENIQNIFRKEQIEILSPHYKAWRDGQESTIPKKVKEDYTFKTQRVDDHTPELDQQIEKELKEAEEKSKKPKSKMPSNLVEMIDQVDDSIKKEETENQESNLPGNTGKDLDK